jgi:hypothetical protein
MRLTTALRLLVLSFLVLIFSHTAAAQIGISVGFGPPPIPIYEQPICPQDGYLWTPGYWSYAEDGGYYWVPGTWIQPPQPTYLWTPGYWGWGGNAYAFHEGYWGPQVGFYGGINYGYGYGGNGYEGGRWEGNRFAYNTSVNRVNTTIIRNTYNTRVVEVSENRVSYNGGNGGVEARANSQQEAYEHEHHVGPVESQNQHVQEARGNPALRASENQGKPAIAATSRPGDFKSGAVASTRAGGEYKAPPPNATEAHPNEARPNETHANDARPNEAKPAEAHPNAEAVKPESKPLPESPSAKPAPASTNHASALQPHTFTPPNTGKPATDQKYQQQQQKLATRQTQDHQKLEKQQEAQHQQATAKNYSDAQKQQQEQKHTQQTQQLEQKHTSQQQHMEQHQAPAKNAPKPATHPN